MYIFKNWNAKITSFVLENKVLLFRKKDEYLKVLYDAVLLNRNED